MLQGRERARGRRAVARPERARRGRADGRRLEFPPRTSAPGNSASHYVITNGGDQPNVVPPNAAVWYYFREADYDHIMNLWRHRRQHGAGRHADDRHRRTRRACSERRGRAISTSRSPRTMYANIKKVGLPQWSEADQTLAKALQHELKAAGARAGHASSRAAPRRAVENEMTARTAAISRPAAAPTTSATSRGTCRRSRCAIRRTFPAARATTGPTAISDGDADRAQGRGRGRQGSGNDDARYPAASGTRAKVVGLLSTTFRPRT